MQANTWAISVRFNSIWEKKTLYADKVYNNRTTMLYLKIDHNEDELDEHTKERSMSKTSVSNEQEKRLKFAGQST